MRKKVIALLLSIVLASGSIGTAPVFAAEPGVEEYAPAEEEESEEESASEQEEAVEEVASEQEEGSEEDDTSEVAEGSEESSNNEDSSVKEDDQTEEEEFIVAGEEGVDGQDDAALEDALADEEEEGFANDDEAGAPSDTMDTLDETEEIEEIDSVEGEVKTEAKEEAALDGDFVASGECGATDDDHVTWTLTGTNDNMTLTISGSGKMKNYDTYYNSHGYSNNPWNRYPIHRVEITYGVTSIGKYAFDHCDKLTSITIPDGVTSIGDNAFEGCSSLPGITIPDSVTSIGEGAFTGCRNLPSITIPDGVTIIEDYTFTGCSKLPSITIPDGVTSIGDRVFSDCSSLQNITIPDGVTSIGFQAFTDCSSLSGISIPDSVTSIGKGAFTRCSSLPSISIPDGVTSIGDNAFEGCSSLQDITIPDGVTSIGYHTFASCSSLPSISIPDSVTSIGEGAFFDCSSLPSIMIPDSVTSIGAGAFSCCMNLKRIYFKGNAPTFERYPDNTFYTFGYITATAYYPPDDTTWTEDVKQDYGGTITWRPMSDYYLTIYAYGASAFDIVFDKAAITLGSGSLGVNEGHTWLLIENNTPIGYDFNGYVIEPYQGMTIGLWPDTTIWTRGYGGVFINLENWAYRDKHVLNDISYYTIPISREDVETIESTAPDESYYHNGAHDKPKADYSDDQRHNCATFAIRMWNKVANTDDQIEEDDIDVPHNYAKKIDSKNKDKYGKKKTTTFVGNSDGLDVCHINKEGKQICFHPGGQPIEVKPSEVSLVVGESVKLEITGAIGKLSGESSNDNIATPTSAGVVNAKSVGQATIYVQAACLPNYFIEDSPERVVRVKVLPAATASITAANQKTGIKVIWKSVPGANGYYIYRNNKKIATISKGSTVTYTDKKANTNGTKYTYKIVAKAFTGTSTLSKSLVTYRLARPEITSLSNNASRKMIVKWGRNTKSSGYQIQYSLKSNFSSKKTVTISKNKTVSKTISKLTKGKKYYVRIRTYKKVGTKKYYSTWSAKKSVVIK